MEVTVSPLNHCELVVVKGRIDSYTAPNLLKELNTLLDQHEYRIILNMEAVSFISSAGMRVLIDAQRKCKQANQGGISLVSLPRRVYESFELTGFTPLFNFYDNVSAAIDAV